MGARIIKVERPEGEQSRYWFPYAENGASAYYSVYNRNKECIAVDLRSDEGKEIIKRLYAVSYTHLWKISTPGILE